MSEKPTGGVPRMIRGSVVVQRRRCGKASCRCAGGEQLHESTVLTYSQDGRNHTVMLDAGEVAPVSAAVARYRAALGRVEREGNAGLAALVARRQQRSGRRR